MAILKSYKDTNNNVYTIETSSKEYITTHCKIYFDYISLSTNTLFNITEIQHHESLLGETFNNGEALLFKVNNVEECILYGIYHSSKIFNVLLMFTYNDEDLPITKLIMINYLYNLAEYLRYTPKDIYIVPNNSLFNKNSLRLLRSNKVESIRFKDRLFDNNLLNYIGLKEIT